MTDASIIALNRGFFGSDIYHKEEIASILGVEEEHVEEVLARFEDVRVKEFSPQKVRQERGKYLSLSNTNKK